MAAKLQDMSLVNDCLIVTSQIMKAMATANEVLCDIMLQIQQQCFHANSNVLLQPKILGMNQNTSDRPKQKQHRYYSGKLFHTIKTERDQKE